MEKAVLETLQVNRILDLIIPLGEPGIQYKRHLKSYKTGQEAQLRKDYHRLEILLQALITDKKLVSLLTGFLPEIPYLPQTLKALQDRALLLHECFMIKKLVYYTEMIRRSFKKNGLDKEYSFPELDNLFTMLDPDNTNSPVFSLSPAFDTRLAKYLSMLQDMELSINKTVHQLLKEAQSSLQMNKPIAELVISRKQKKEIKALEQTGYYMVVNENFANLTYRLKDTPKLAALRKQLTELNSKLGKAEEEALGKLSKKIAKFQDDLLRSSELIQQLDWDYAKATFYTDYNCCLPKVSSKHEIMVRQAVNLPVKLAIEAEQRVYQPLDLQFACNVNILTGPNMGGKTTALTTLGQMVVLTHVAIPLPAKEALLCMFDHVWFNRETGGGENLSSFGKEIVSLTNVLKKAGKTMFLLDELAKGTNPMEGKALLTAVLQYLTEKDCITLAATHYDVSENVKAATQYLIKGIDNKALDKLSRADKNTIDEQLDLLNKLMDYSLFKLTTKTKPPQNAIPIAAILGLPEEILSQINIKDPCIIRQ